MDRVKVNLASGNIFEKPLITCFKGTNGEYIVLDNETNGSMGLPIICISRIEGSSLIKIVDPTEWASVKENLKTIIAGTALPYLKVADNLNASDDFYTQLTLPIASFDLLKNKYAESQVTPVVEEPVVQVEAPIADVSPVGPTPTAPEASTIGSPIETPIVPSFDNPINPTIEQPLPVVEPVIEPVSPIPTPEVTPSFETAIPEINPVGINEEVVAESQTNTFDQIPVSEPVIPTESVTEFPQAPVINNDVIAPVEIANPISESANSINDQDLIAMKENFMKSCETMFDALVEKLKK